MKYICSLISDQRDSVMVMKMIEFVHDHGPRWIIAIVRELSILSLKGSRILRFPFGLIGSYSFSIKHEHAYVIVVENGSCNTSHSKRVEQAFYSKYTGK
jgi:hypothetical protein